MPELLKCAVCHGQVSSDALCCPHCGSRDYTLQKLTYQLQQKKLRQERQEQRVKKYGSVLLELCENSKWPSHPYGIYYYTMTIDGEMLWDKAGLMYSRPGEMVEEQSRRIGDSDDYKRIFFIRVHPGSHTITLTSGSVKSRKKVSSLTFSCDEHSRYITIEIKSNNLNNHVKLKSITVE